GVGGGGGGRGGGAVADEANDARAATAEDPGRRRVGVRLRDERGERARLLSHLGEKAPTRLCGHQPACPLSARSRRGARSSGSASATWQATRRSVPIGRSVGVTAVHVATA